MKIFLDTNVILDLLEPERPGAESSAIIYQLAQGRQIEVFVSTQSIIDSYYIGGNFGVPKAEIDTLANWMMNHFNVRAIDCFDMKKAVSSPDPDVEDNAQIVLAEDAGCHCFVTHDKGILAREKEDGMLLISPEQLVARMQ